MSGSCRLLIICANSIDLDLRTDLNPNRFLHSYSAPGRYF